MQLTKSRIVSKKYLVPVLLTVSLSMVGCMSSAPKKNTAESKPDWVMVTPSMAGYIYGVGTAEVYGGNEGAAISRAKDVARVELIKQIKVDISGVVEQETQEVTRGSQTVLTQNLRSAVTSRVPEFTLTNVEQVDSYRWADGRNVSVMVRLDVNKELRSLASQIGDLDQQLGEYQAKLGGIASSNLSVLRELSPALVLADERAALQARANALAPSSGLKPLMTSDIRGLVSRIYELISQLKIAITSDGMSDAAFRTNLIAQLTERGLTVTDGQHQANAQISYALRVNELQRDGAKFAITEGDVSLKDESGRVVKAFQAKAKGGASDAVEARSKSIKKLADQLGDELLTALLK